MSDTRGTSPIWESGLASQQQARSSHPFAFGTVAPIEHPTQVGPYRIVSVLGEGGMGTVYSAEQVEPVQRRVALKLIKLGMDTRQVIARFQAERQTLALMEHPNIARVFDAGTTETGRPYFVMEMVDGVPLTSYCDQHKLSMSRRLELFAQVCDAVQHAHTKGVIHRDLKPGNVLVGETDGKPVPKVIDFGVAKAIEHRSVERTVFTEMGAMVGTPEYMSPEQAQPLAEDVDARTDVYSLGVMLYELLSGALPFDAKTLRSQAYQEIQRIIREVDPPRPSTRLLHLEAKRSTELATTRGETVATLTASLRRELEWIPLKAMRKNREHRYRTAIELADDVRNYLAGRPLLAGPESGAYRARKFLHRNRVPVAIAAMMLVLLVGGIVATTYQAIRATRAERAARQEKAEADLQRAAAQRRFEDVRALAKRLIFELHPEVDRLAGSATAVRKIIDMSLEYLSKLQADASDDARLIKDVAGAYHRLGDIQGNPHTNNVGDTTGAAQSYDRAQLMSQRAAALQPNDANALSLLAISDLKIGDLLDRQGKREEAMKHFTAAQRLFERAASAAPDEIVDQVNLLVAPQRIAVAKLEMGDVEGALKGFEQDLANSRALVKRFPGDPRAARMVPSALEHLGQAQMRAGRYADAAATWREKVSLYEAMLAADHDDAQVQSALAETLLSLARVRMTYLSDVQGAELAAARALEVLERCYDADPTNTASLNALTRTLIVQYDVLLRLDRLDEAQRVVERSMALLRKALETTPSDRAARRNLIVCYGQLADLLERRDEFAAALDARRSGMELLRPLIDADPDNATLQAGLAFTRRQIAGTLFKLGDYGASRDEARGAIAILERLSVQNPADVRNKASLLNARRTLINALDGIATDARTSPDDRASYRAEIRSHVATMRQGYEELQKLGALSPDDLKSWRGLDQVLIDVDDDARIGKRQPAATTTTTTSTGATTMP